MPCSQPLMRQTSATLPSGDYRVTPDTVRGRRWEPSIERPHVYGRYCSSARSEMHL